MTQSIMEIYSNHLQRKAEPIGQQQLYEKVRHAFAQIGIPHIDFITWNKESYLCERTVAVVRGPDAHKEMKGPWSQADLSVDLGYIHTTWNGGYTADSFRTNTRVVSSSKLEQLNEYLTKQGLYPMFHTPLSKLIKAY